MSYRKLRADHIFTGNQLLDKDHVLITDREGKIESIVSLTEAGEDIETVKGILSPGFINCHCHLELSYLKDAIPEKTGMVDFLLSVLGKRNYPPEQVQSSIANAEQSMLENGIVAVGDICNTSNTYEHKARNAVWAAGNSSKGFIRQEQKNELQLHYTNFIEATGFVENTAVQRFEDYRNIFNEFASLSWRPIDHTSLVPHAPYSVSPALFHSIVHFTTRKARPKMNSLKKEPEKCFDYTNPSASIYPSLNPVAKAAFKLICPGSCLIKLLSLSIM
jgi:cytosine/adenosine deaminase-related metal-dependent hydrolase